jgi:hypothetical protein
MLIDQVLGDPDWRTRRGMSEDLRERLSKATKFVLNADFAIAADEFRQDFENLNKGRMFCRLPFIECWIEYAHGDQLICSNVPPPLTMGRPVKKRRIGYLLTQTDDGGAFDCRLFVSFDREPTWLLAPSTLIFNPQAEHIEKAFRHGLEATENWASKEMVNEIWRGESRYLTAILELLHSRNAVDTSLVDLSRLNRRRAQQRRPKFFSYHLVSIPGRYKQRHIAGEASGIEVRAHFVRGHFKVRKTGIFFWSPFQRGNPALGRVHKDYVLAKPDFATLH